ncbi:hypothetical protein Phum_PHUM613140 [Pediculus humanus corporis]|uniref:Deltamethrin resistance protein prag01 domain-containing protein n=1 Tax=Pediculus humanus subsp. corporis TaxID=121224 RepID=E0W3Z5_PEDHC|nr:uncharacterized protein Phum_PHUM613140 [Pediculus humanus corporis]EEB20351.1 hypothetical protein Phum_PHUM613140 [Pediculus humanus corporis]
MLSKTLVPSLTLAKRVLPLCGQRQKIGNLLVAQYSSHSKHLEGYKYPTMDDVPIPCGSWQEDYDNNQRKYNLHLLLGAGFFIITMVSWLLHCKKM